MIYLRKFDSVSDMEAAVAADKISFIGIAKSGNNTERVIHTHAVIPPTNLVISCTNNFVTITATNATTIEYNTDGSSTYTTYTEPFHITESGTVNARATNADGSITASQAVTYIDYRPVISITEANNFVTVTAADANTILYRLGTIGEYVAYTGPVYIAEDTTIYVQATRTVAGVDYTSTASQQCAYVDYAPPVSISESNNYVTIISTTADSITYRLGSSGEYSTYTEPVYIAADTTIYVIATRTVSGVTYTTEKSQEVTHELIPPTNLVISCASNTVTITATNATTIEYNFDGSDTYTTYTQPFEISETVTVYAKATNSDGSITTSQQCEYVEPSDYTTPFYIEDISGSENTVQITKTNSSATTLTIEKSTDGTTWTSMGTTSTTAITATIPANSKLYLRCSTNAWAVSSNYNTIRTTGNCNVGGNIMSLLYGSNFTGEETTFPSGSTYNFYNLFYNNARLVNASELVLPATTLTEGCYHAMFQNCTSLTTAPALPATTLTDSCYGGMFYNCALLTTAPELPATTLATTCYQTMFQNCTSLTTAPALPATTLAGSCYSRMFYNCTSLTTAPALPATTLANTCYNGMFQNCTSLTTAPTLPATTLTQSCYSSMFYNCTSLTTAPALPATTLAYYCYSDMFYGCTSLTTAPALPVTTLTYKCYSNMFQKCTSLTTAPELPATTLTDSCYQGMFSGCTSLTTAPALPATTLAYSCYQSMFNGCTNLNYIKCLATDISASSCTYYWVNKVGSTGTFVKAASMSDWTTGTDGIPSGWTVQDATE